MLVSIILPTFNRAHTLGRAIDSVLEQTYTNWELLIIDNHSTDTTAQLIDNYHNSKIILLKIHNEGIIAKSRNLGIRQANGELIAFLDSDDWWTNEKLNESVSYMIDGADLVYHDLWRVSSENQLLLKRIHARKLGDDPYNSLIDYGNAMPNSSIVVKKTCLYDIGGMSEDTKLVAWEDYDCWLRLSKLTNRLVRINKTLGYYWEGGENVSNPQLTLKILDRFKERYLPNSYEVLPVWFEYSKGRNLYKIGSYDKAISHLMKVIVCGKSTSLKLKSLITVILIKVKQLHNCL